MPENEFIIELKHITKRFPGVTANDDVSVSVRRGEIFALLGENGAGKSTLMSMLFGLYEPDEGEIIIRGKPERIISPRYAASLSIGMVHQHFRLVENFTVAENIILGVEPGSPFYVNLKQASSRIRELSVNYGLDIDPSMLIEDLSVSLRQRVEILKMLYREAEILIFDEPTAMLAPREIEYLLQILRNLRESGKTIILISHKLDEIKSTSDRCAILNRGKLVGIYDVESISTREMAAHMVGHELGDETPPEPHAFGDTVLSVENLTVMENGAERVSNVSFEIHAGEIFAVAGVDNNGQTQLADAIFGLLDITGGNVRINGSDVTKKTVRDRISSGLRYVPEDRHGTGLLLDFDLSRNLTMRRYTEKPYSVHGILRFREFRAFASRMIGDFDIRSGKGASTIVRSMSGGNQQKAIVAREIESGENLLIFVQPTRGLDIGATRAIHKHILNERDKGRAILLISLELEEITVLADTIGVMYSGNMNRIAPARDLSIAEIGEYMTGARKE